MVRRILGLFALFCVTVFCGTLSAQTVQTETNLTIRLLDSRTGKIIATSDVLVQINHQTTFHSDWITHNEDGTAKLTLPQKASVLAVQAKYESGMTMYVNCDSAKDKGEPVARWYSVSDILTTGVVAPNGCSKRTAAAKPGEFVLFIRTQNLREQVEQ